MTMTMTKKLPMPSVDDDDDVDVEGAMGRPAPRRAATTRRLQTLIILVHPSRVDEKYTHSGSPQILPYGPALPNNYWSPCGIDINLLCCFYYCLNYDRFELS